MGLGGRSIRRQRPTIANNEIQHPSLPNQSMLLFIKGRATVGPWTIKSSDHHVITPNDGEKILVSVEAAVQDLNNNLTVHGTTVGGAKRAQDDKISQDLARVGSIMLGSLSTGFSAMGPKFAAAAGIVGLLGGLIGEIGGAGGSGEPPAPPNIDQIKSAIMEVAEKQVARDAATLFAENYDWFHSVGGRSQASRVALRNTS